MKKKKWNEITPENIASAKDLRLRGMDYKEIGEMLKCTKSRAKRLVKSD